MPPSAVALASIAGIVSTGTDTGAAGFAALYATVRGVLSLDGFLVKWGSWAVSFRALRQVLRRDRPAWEVARKVRRGGEFVPLGPTEFRLLKHFLEHPGRVFSRERLLDTVWSHDSDIELRTVDVHVRRLRKALNEGGKPDLIRTVRSAGYSLDADD